MSKVTHIGSSSQFSSIVSSSTYVIVDFYADWCGPCKTIAPVFEQLASSEAKPGKLAFVKVNVDNQQDVAQRYGVSAMPTFLILKNGAVSNTIRGANASALRSAVMAAASDAAKGPAKQSAAFSSKGQVLGDSSTKSRASAGGGTGFSLPTGSVDDLIRFAALYFTTLFSFDAAAAASASPFSRAAR